MWRGFRYTVSLHTWAAGNKHTETKRTWRQSNRHDVLWQLSFKTSVQTTEFWFWLSGSMWTEQICVVTVTFVWNVVITVRWPLTFDHQILTSSSLSQSECLFSVWRDSSRCSLDIRTSWKQNTWSRGFYFIMISSLYFNCETGETLPVVLRDWMMWKQSCSSQDSDFCWNKRQSCFVGTFNFALALFKKLIILGFCDQKVCHYYNIKRELMFSSVFHT